MRREEKSSGDTFYYIKLFSAVTLAFAGTYFALPARGLISTLPVFLIASLVSVLISIPSWQKASLFGFFAFFFALIEYDSLHALGFAVLCILTVLISSLTFLLMQKKKVFHAIITLILLFSVAYPHAYFFGNIFEAKEADNRLREYTAERYTSDDIVISPTFYDYGTKSYRVSVYDRKTPTEVYTVSTGKRIIYDSYSKYTERALMNKKMLEITAVLRNAFPNDSFEVIPVRINGYPFDGAISISDDTDYSYYMQFRILLSGQLDREYFLEKSTEYFEAISRQGMSYSRITFATRGLHLSALSVTVTDNPLLKDLDELMSPPVYYGFDKRIMYYIVN